jgi:Tol biopolymer transport system component
MPNVRPTDDELPILRELGGDLKRAFLTASEQASDGPGPQPARSSHQRVRVGIGALAAAVSVMVAVGVAVLAVVLLGHGRTAARSKNAASPVSSQQRTAVKLLSSGNVIVFDTSTSDGLDARSEIAYVSARGGPVLWLNTARKRGMVAADPRWSPDGSRIVFVMSPVSHFTRYAGDGDIYIMDANGTRIRQLTHGLAASAPSWSPDGSQIAFIKGQGQALAVMHSNGSDQHVIARGRGYYESPAWSPNGRAIAYVSGRGWGAHAIFAVGTNGSGERQLTQQSPSLSDPAWSPNGSQIAYSSKNRLWIMQWNGTRAHAITTCRLPCVDDFEPSWSPTGNRLVFVRQEDGGRATHLYVVELPTAKLTLLTPRIRWASSPDWRP